MSLSQPNLEKKCGPGNLIGIKFGVGYVMDVRTYVYIDALKHFAVDSVV